MPAEKNMTLRVVVPIIVTIAAVAVGIAFFINATGQGSGASSNKPADAHVHATSGEYTYEDDFVLSEANGFTAHTDWVLEAKVWGDTDGEDEEVSTVEFHVHPK